jgi:hypothetical protein
MEKENSTIKEPVRLAEGRFEGRLDTNETLRILDRTRRKYELSDNSLLNVAFIPVGGNKYEYLVYANLPGAPLPLNYQNEKGLVHFIGGKILWPIVEAPKAIRTNRQNFDALFAPAPEQDTRYIQHTVSLRNKHGKYLIK